MNTDRTEFYKDKSGCFKPEVYVHFMDEKDPIPFKDIPENVKTIWFNLFLDNKETRNIILNLRTRKITDRDEVLEYIIEHKFGKIDKVWDIDFNKLNYEA